MYAIIAGGGKVGFFLARELIDQGHEILIIENSPELAEFIANELGNVVLRGNADETIICLRKRSHHAKGGNNGHVSTTRN